MKYARKDFNHRFYVTTIEDLMKASEVLYELRIFYTVKSFIARDVTDSEKPGTAGFMLCYNIWDGRHRRQLEEALVDSGVIFSSCAS